MRFRDHPCDSRKTPDGWRRELGQLLRLWEMGYRRGSPKKDTATDAQMWERLLPHARPIHPRTYLPGAMDNARLKGLDWESKARSGEVLVEGERVAIRRLRRDNDISRALGGHGWQIAFESDGLEADSQEYEFLERCFRTVIPFTGGCIASEEPLDGRSALVPLARFCFSQPTTAHFRRCFGGAPRRIQRGTSWNGPGWVLGPGRRFALRSPHAEAGASLPGPPSAAATTRPVCGGECGVAGHRTGSASGR